MKKAVKSGTGKIDVLKEIVMSLASPYNRFMKLVHYREEFGHNEEVERENAAIAAMKRMAFDLMDASVALTDDEMLQREMKWNADEMKKHGITIEDIRHAQLLAGNE